MSIASGVSVDAPNPYLEGVYAPVGSEITARDLPVIGELPEDLAGTYARNGPNPQFAPMGRYHWFDGDGMVHAVAFDGGTASYRNRWVRTKAFQREAAQGGPLWTGVVEPTAENPAFQPIKDNAATDVIFHHGDLLATHYLCGEPYRLDPVTLETRGTADWGGTRTTLVSAHTKVDERTGELLFFDYGPEPPYLQYGVVGADGRVAHLIDVPLPGWRLPHDMAFTEHYALLMDLPLIHEPKAAAAGRYKIQFARGLPSRFAVVPRRGSTAEVRWFEAEPCYIYHVVNAWEQGPEIVLDVCRVKRGRATRRPDTALASILSYLRLDAQLWRYRFDLLAGTVTEEPLDDDNAEFPAINSWFGGRPSQFGYLAHIADEDTMLFDGVVKYDTRTGCSTRWMWGERRWGSEVAFVPRPGVTAEDGGYLVGFVHDEIEDRSEVVVLDATDVESGPLARILLPQRVPIGFHACWYHAAQPS